VKIDRRTISKRVKKAEGATTRHAQRFIVHRMDSVRSARRHIVGWLVLVGVLIAASGAQLLWYQKSYQVTAADSGGSYAEATLGSLDTLNPLFASSDSEATASELLFSSLYTYDTAGKLHGDLAESATPDKTGRIYSVKLRPDARWHDGRQLTAEDVVFTVNLMKNSETRAKRSLQATWEDVTVKAVDRTTLKFTLPAVYAAFPYALTFAVLPQHVLKNVTPAAIRENTYSRSPIGSGPFKFSLLQSANNDGVKKVVKLNANEKYYEGAPKLARFEIHTYQSQDEITSALKTGEVNGGSVPPSSASQLKNDKFNIYTKPVDSGVYALFNTISPILKDKSVRLALQAATDTKTLRQSFQSNAPAIDLPFISGQLTGPNVPKVPLPNAAKANAILDKAGWNRVGDVRKKGGQELALTITTTKSDQYEKAAESLSKQWRDLGITVKTNVIDVNEPTSNFVQNTLQPRNYDVLLYELLIGADPDIYAYWHSSQSGTTGYNFSNYSNPVADTALASARSRLEPELRNAKYISFAKEWVRDAPAIGLYQPVYTYVSGTSSRTLSSSSRFDSATDRFANITDWSVRTKSVYKTP